MPSNIVLSDLLDFCSPQNKAIGNVDDLRATLMAFSEYIPASSFFNKDGTPYTYAEICEMAKAQVLQLQKAASRGKTSSAQNYLRNQLTVDRYGRRIVSRHVTDVVVSTMFRVKPRTLEENARKAVVDHSVGTAIVGAFLACKDYLSGKKLGKSLREKVQQNIRKWEAEKDSIREFPAKIHKKIKQACADSESNSIKDVRVWVMKHQPRATARVLVHPSGRLLSEREICMALKVYG